MNRIEPTARRESQTGVVLLESLLAILIFSIGVLAVIGLQATMIKSNAEAKYRSEASYLAQKQIGLMWADPGNLPTAQVVINVAPPLPGGTLTITPLAAPQFDVSVRWQQPGEPAHILTTIATVAGG